MPIVPGIPGTRYDRIGTIFSRVSGLIRSGTITGLNIPIWYPIYQAFPPKYEPKFDRPAPNINISNIVYQEDKNRAKLHKLKQVHPFDLTITGPIDETYYFNATAHSVPTGKENLQETK